MPVPFLAALGSGRHAAAAALKNALGQTESFQQRVVNKPDSKACRERSGSFANRSKILHGTSFFSKRHLSSDIKSKDTKRATMPPVVPFWGDRSPSASPTMTQ